MKKLLLCFCAGVGMSVICMLIFFKNSYKQDLESAKVSKLARDSESSQVSKFTQDSKSTQHYDITYLREMYSKDSREWEKPFVDSGVEWEEIGALPLTPPYPASNPYSKEKATLGEKLFNEPLLSLSKQIACASCHDKEQGFSNGRSLAFGHDRQLGRRNSPSVVMSAFGKEKFWDGRAESLEAQAAMPIADPKEMAFSIESAAKRLNQIPAYKETFKAAFGSATITSERIAQAIATYQRSLMPKYSKFDRFMRENAKARDEKAQSSDKPMADSKDSKIKDSKTIAKTTKKPSEILSDKEILGLHLFRTKARCINCHFGVAFSDQQYHNLGLTFYGREKQDLGRYEITGNPTDSGKFKTPSLRQVAKTAPYMHIGTFPNLSSVLASYNFGMGHIEPKTEEQKNNPAFPITDKLLKPLNLSDEEIEALEAFLRTL